MRRLIAQAEFKFKIIQQSSMLIASMDVAAINAINVGGIDAAMARNPITKEPFLQPSSLKGKLRAICFQTMGADKAACYFGPEHSEIVSRDLLPSVISVKAIQAHVPAGIPPFHEKSENTISKLVPMAKPRLMEVASKGMEYFCTLMVNQFNDSEPPEKIIKEVIIPLLSSLEDDYIGGCGTRGFGEVEIYVETSGVWVRVNKAEIDSIKTVRVDFSKEIAVEIDNRLKELKEEIVYMTTGFFSDDKIQSSTLAGLFAYALADMWQDPLIDYIYSGKDFFISSAFPCIDIDKDSEKIHFFPRPLRYVEGIKTHDNKKAFLYDFQYISETMLCEFFKDTGCLKTWCDGIGDSYKIKDNMLMTLGEYNLIENLNLKLTASADLMHVSIDPNTGFYREVPDPDNPAIKKGVLFSTHDHFYSDKFKFFFLVKHRFKDIQPILRRIEQLGIGRDKSTGMGYFNFEVKNGSALQHANPNASQHFSLSLIHPAKEEWSKLSDVGNSYRVITRKGKRENNSYDGTDNFRAEKDKIFMLQEGSIFNFDIKGSSPVVLDPRNKEKYKIRDFGHAYTIRF
jgi:CRISPR-associated protein Csm3